MTHLLKIQCLAIPRGQFLLLCSFPLRAGILFNMIDCRDHSNSIVESVIIENIWMFDEKQVNNLFRR